MDFLELAKKRQSCRNFDSTRTVEREKITSCLEAARLAPSACNAQPYHFTVAKGLMAQKVGKACTSLGQNKFATDVPFFIIVSEDRYNLTAKFGAMVKEQDFKSVDMGIAVAYLTAQATSLGLSTCILGWFDEEAIQKICNIKNRIRLVIAIGYGKDSLREKKRKDLSQISDFL